MREVVSVEEARRIAVRAQLLDGTATDVLEHRAAARLPPARPDLDRRAAAAPRPLEPARPRFDRAELDRLLWEERKLVEWNAFLWPDRGPAAPEGADAPTRPARSTGGSIAFLKENAVVPPLRAARARAARAAALARDRRPRADAARGAPLVGRAQDGADARRAERARRGRRRRAAWASSASGISPSAGIRRPRRVPLARGASGIFEEKRFRALGVQLERGAAGSRTRTREDGPVPHARHVPVPVRPPDPRPRPGGGALGLLLPARDVRPGGEARVRLLRPADPARRPDRRPDRAGATTGRRGVLPRDSASGGSRA